MATNSSTYAAFLSSNTQDFIEVMTLSMWFASMSEFLSSNTQDFIEVRKCMGLRPRVLYS